MALAKLLTSLCFVFIFSHLFIVSAIENKIEDRQLEYELKVLNKLPLKTIKTKEGDIVDCIHIYKQYTLDHSSFKNHKIQVKPTNVPKNGLEGIPKAKKAQKNILGTVDCPRGTVPRLRTSKEYQIRAKSFFNKITTNNIQPSEVLFPRRQQAIMRSVPLSGGNTFTGIIADVEVYNPSVGADQSSSTQVWIQTGSEENIFNNIQFGWMVNPALFEDNRTRSFMIWKAAKTYSGRSFILGCINLLCNGFIQTDNTFVLGGVLSDSSITFEISRDALTGHWWLVLPLAEIYVGYWPRWIVPLMSNGASKVAWGGETFADDNLISPGMGSGSFPSDSSHSGCLISYMQVASGKYYRDPEEEPSHLERIVDNSDCYDLNHYAKEIEIGYAFYFGGPGGSRCAG